MNYGTIKPDDPDFSKVFLHRNQMPPNFRAVVGMRLEFDIGAPSDSDISKQLKGGCAFNVKCE